VTLPGVLIGTGIAEPASPPEARAESPAPAVGGEVTKLTDPFQVSERHPPAGHRAAEHPESAQRAVQDAELGRIINGEHHRGHRVLRCETRRQQRERIQTLLIRGGSERLLCPVPDRCLWGEQEIGDPRTLGRAFPGDQHADIGLAGFPALTDTVADLGEHLVVAAGRIVPAYGIEQAINANLHHRTTTGIWITIAAHPEVGVLLTPCLQTTCGAVSASH